MQNREVNKENLSEIVNLRTNSSITPEFTTEDSKKTSSGIVEPGWTRKPTTTETPRRVLRRRGSSQTLSTSTSSNRKILQRKSSKNSIDENLDFVRAKKTEFKIDLEFIKTQFDIEDIDSIAERHKMTGLALEEEVRKVLKRGKPKQRLTGYVKQYHTEETTRLAHGYKEYNENTKMFMDDLKENDQKVSNMVTKMGKTIYDQKSTVKSLQTELNTCEADLNQSTAKLNNLSTLYEQVKAESEDLKLKNRDSLNLNEKLEEKCSNLENTLDSMKASYNEEKTTLEQLISCKTTELSEKQHIIDEQNKEISKIPYLTEKLEISNDSLNDLRKKYEEKETMITKVLDSFQGSQNTIDELTKQLETANKSLEREIELREKLQDSKELILSENSNYKNTIALSEEKHKNLLKETVDDFNRYKEKAETDLKDHLEKYDDIKKMLENTESLLNAEKSNCKRLENELIEMKNDASLKTNEMSNLIKEKIQIYEEYKQDTENKIEEHKKEYQLLQAELTQEKDKFSETKLKLESDKIDLEENLAKLSSEKSDLQEELVAMRKTYEEVKQNQETEQLYKLNREMEAMQKRVVQHEELKVVLQQTEDKLFDSEREKRELRNEIQNLKGTVRVIARVKPKQIKENDRLDVGIDERTIKLLVQTENNSGKSLKPHVFKFNHVFSQNSTQTEVFDEVASFIQSALDGYNVCLFSYGQTGSGKTYTMTGDKRIEEAGGIIPRSTSHIMSYKRELERMGWKFKLQATFVEIYNETIQDLLAKASESNSMKGKKCEVRESKNEIIVTNVCKEDIESVDDVYQLLNKAENRRKVEKTDMNERSSRSHSVFTIFITGTHDRKSSKIKGSLSLCDLAGSERLKKSNVTGERLRETQNINKSLSSLSDVFLALNRQGMMRARQSTHDMNNSTISGMQQSSIHIPYRNSKLTQILRPCFSGEGKILMIVNVSSENRDVDETFCSLRFAKQVNQTEVGRAKKNVEALEDETASQSSESVKSKLQKPRSRR